MRYDGSREIKFNGNTKHFDEKCSQQTLRHIYFTHLYPNCESKYYFCLMRVLYWERVGLLQDIRNPVNTSGRTVSDVVPLYNTRTEDMNKNKKFITGDNRGILSSR